MSLANQIRSEHDRRMFEYIQEQHGTNSGPNAEAETVFNAVQCLFDGNEGQVIITSSLLHNLAACAVVALGYDRNQRIPLDKNDHDHILVRTFSALLTTLYEAIREKRTRERNGKTYYGFFHIPDWYVQHIQSIPH